MTAHIYCWAPELDLDPARSSFPDELGAVDGAPPSQKLLSFVSDLLNRYEDVTVSDDTVWGDGPLIRNISGDFINMSLVWSRYEEAAPFIVSTAHAHQLNCYDPQTGEFFPARRP